MTEQLSTRLRRLAELAEAQENGAQLETMVFGKWVFVELTEEDVQHCLTYGYDRIRIYDENRAELG